MIGPVIVIGGVAAAGAILGGWPGLVGGALIGIGLVAAIVASMAGWVQQIGRHLDPAEARAAAPRPWGFAWFSERVYRQLD